MGQIEKKIKINGKSLLVSDKKFQIDLDKSLEYQLKQLLSDEDSISISTSGSTGTPKVIELKKEHIWNSARATLDFLDVFSGSRALLCMSPDHIGGLMMVARSIVGDLDLYPVKASSNPLESVSGDFDFAAMVPLQVEESLGHIDRIKTLIIGGGPLKPSLEEVLKSRPGAIFHTYGMTETISHVAMRRVSGPESSDFYKALPGVSFSVDERGCLVINARAIGVQGLITNDIVDLRDDRRFIWRGRADNAINSGGIKLIPEQLERKIGNIGYDYFLAGMKDEKWGERLVMIIESTEPTDIDKSFLSGYLERFEVPKDIYLLEHFQRTDSGKVNRPKNLKEVRDGGYHYHIEL